MNDTYLARRAADMIVTHEHSGKSHFFKVRTLGKEEYEISLQVNCTCEFMSNFGHSQKKICSHILAVLRAIVLNGGEINGIGKRENP